MKTNQIVEMCVKEQGLMNLTRNQVDFLENILEKENFAKLKSLGDIQLVFNAARKFAKNNPHYYENI